LEIDMRLYVTQGSGNSFKPVLALRQLGRACEITFVDVVAGETRRPEFLTINPAGAVPYLLAKGGYGLGESNAILWYLADGSLLIPTSPYDRAKALQWMFFEQTALEPFISPARFFTCIAPHLAEDHAVNIPVWREKAKKGLTFLDRHLFGRRFITDHAYCVADISVYGYTHLAGEADIDLGHFPAVQAWMARVEDTQNFAPIGTLLNPRTAGLIGSGV
jgi:glutathione S-transferase